MWRLLLLLLLSGPAEAQTVGPQPVLCNKTAIGSSGAATVQTVAPIAGQVVNICGYEAMAGAAAGSFQLTTGTGATCGTATVTITASYPFGAGVGLVNPSTYVRYSTPQGNGVCVVITGTGPVAWTLFYSQF
jgi:hypothetical protein